MNAEIRRAILGTVPASECFRWDVRSRSEWRVYHRATAYNNRIPTRLMSLSSDPLVGLADLFDGQHDIRTGHYRYERNPLYKQSPLYRTGHDLEFFSALLYLKGLLESPLPDRQLLEQEGLASVAAVMQAARSIRTIFALSRNAYLRARIRYLLASIAATAARPRDTVDLLLSRSGVKSLLGFVRENASGFGDEIKYITEGPDGPRCAAMSSARLYGDVYRTEWLAKGWVGADKAAQELQAISPGSDSRRGPPLGDGEHLVLASPEIPVTAGRAPSAGAGRRLGDDIPQEFIYFNIDVTHEERLLAGYGYGDEDIALFMAIFMHDQWAVYPLPGQVRQYPITARVLVSLNALGLLQQLSEEGNPKMRLFLSAWGTQ